MEEYTNPMNIYYFTLAAIGVGTFILATVFLVLTLIQLKRTAREAELLVHKVNSEMEKMGNVTAAVSGFAGAMGGSASRLLGGVASLVFHMIQNRRRKKSPEAPSEKGEPS